MNFENGPRIERNGKVESVNLTRVPIKVVSLPGHDVAGQLAHTLVQVVVTDQVFSVLCLIHLLLKSAHKVLGNQRLYNGEALLHHLERTPIKNIYNI